MGWLEQVLAQEAWDAGSVFPVLFTGMCLLIQVPASCGLIGAGEETSRLAALSTAKVRGPILREDISG